MMQTVYLLIFLIIVTTGWVAYLTKRKFGIFLHLFFLTATPWVLTLVLGRPSLRFAPMVTQSLEKVGDNIGFLTSFDFLFFFGDRRPDYGTGVHGVFLLTFLPLVAMGVYRCLMRSDWRYKITFFLLVLGIMIGACSYEFPTLGSSMWYVPTLSVVATIGGLHMLKKPKGRMNILFVGFLIWFFYELVRFYQIIIFHKPF